MAKSHSNEYCNCGKLISEHEWQTNSETGEVFKICEKTGTWEGTERKDDILSQLNYPPALSFSDRIKNVSNIFQVETQVAEKIVRINDILKAISNDSILKHSMVLIGGTAINLGVHGQNPPRLSMDLDFNYRGALKNQKIDHTTDAAVSMDIMKNNIENILQQLHYSLDNIKYKSRFELGTFTMFYKNEEELDDSLKIEICYSRRIPLVQESEDQGDHFQQIKILDSIETFLPSTEELFAEKVAAMLRRKLIRDIFDVYFIYKTINEGMVEKNLLRKCCLVCILYQSIDPRKIDFNKLFTDIKEKGISKEYIHSTKRLISKQSTDQMIDDVEFFLNDIFRNFSENENRYFDQYFNEGIFQPDLIDPDNELHPDLSNQSEIQWLLMKRLKK